MIRHLLVSSATLPANPMVFQQMPLAHQWCRGKGLELGAAAHNPFGLPGALNVAPWHEDEDHPDRRDFEFYAREQVKLCGYFAAVDLAGEADAIPMEVSSQDYVISSHVVEHLPNLIGAFVEWNRVLKPGGIVLMIVPFRDALEEDRVRPITPLHHFVDDWKSKATVQTHRTNCPGGRRGHYHVFTLARLTELVDWCEVHNLLNWEPVASEDVDSKVGNGFTLVYRKAGG